MAAPSYSKVIYNHIAIDGVDSGVPNFVSPVCESSANWSKLENSFTATVSTSSTSLVNFSHWEVYGSFIPDGWNGSTSTTLTYSDSLGDDATGGETYCIAHYTSTSTAISVEWSPQEYGTCSLSKTSITWDTTTIGRSNEITLTCTPLEGYYVDKITFRSFDGWTHTDIETSEIEGVQSIGENDGKGGVQYTRTWTLGYPYNFTSNIVFATVEFAKCISVIRAEVSPSDSGTINGEDSFYEVMETGDTYTLTAEAFDGWKFKKWTNDQDDEEIEEERITREVCGDIAWKANFVEVVKVDVSVNMAICGKVELYPQSEDGDFLYEIDTELTATFIPNDKQVTFLGFIEWVTFQHLTDAQKREAIHKDNPYTFKVKKPEGTRIPAEDVNRMEIRAEASPKDGRILAKKYFEIAGVTFNYGLILATDSSGNILSRSAPIKEEE